MKRIEGNAFLSTPQILHLHFTALHVLEAELANSTNTKETRAGKKKLACKADLWQRGQSADGGVLPWFTPRYPGALPGKGGTNSLTHYS